MINYTDFPDFCEKFNFVIIWHNKFKNKNSIEFDWREEVINHEIYTSAIVINTKTGEINAGKESFKLVMMLNNPEIEINHYGWNEEMRQFGNITPLKLDKNAYLHGSKIYFK